MPLSVILFTAGGLKLVLADDRYLKSSCLEALTQHLPVVRLCRPILWLQHGVRGTLCCAAMHPKVKELLPGTLLVTGTSIGAL